MLDFEWGGIATKMGQIERLELGRKRVFAVSTGWMQEFEE
jgi:hypothetical protein